MSYMALVTERFDEMAQFYGELLGFPAVDEWERDNARGVRFDTGGMRLEIIDNTHEQRPLELGETADRVHIVIEVDDVEAARAAIAVPAPDVMDTSWGSRLFRIHDPDGVPVTYLQWLK